MSDSTTPGGVNPGGVKRFLGHWRWIAAVAVIAAFGAAYAGKKLSSSAPPEPTAVAQQARATAAAPSTSPAASEQAPSGGLASPPPALDLNGSRPAAEPETPAEAIASQTIDVASRPVAALEGQGNWTNGLQTLSDAIAKVNAASAKAGLQSDGRPLVVFTDTDDNGFRFRAMVPLAKAPGGKTDLADGVEIAASPGGKALKFQHRGPYDDIDTTYEAITAFLDEKGLDTKNLFIEEYLTDLKTAEDEGLEIDIYVFLK